MSRLLSSLFLGCAMLCCAVLSCTVRCCKFPEPNAPVATGREDHLPSYHQGPGSPRPQCWSALPPLLEGEDRLHHAGPKESKGNGGGRAGAMCRLRFGSPKKRAQHSATQHIKSHHSTAQHRTQHSTTGEKGSFCGYGGAGAWVGAGAGAGGWGGVSGFVTLLSLTHHLLITPLPHQKRQSNKARKRQSKRKCEVQRNNVTCNIGEVVHPAIMVAGSLRGVKLQDVKVWALQRRENRGTLIYTLKKHRT